MGFTAVGIPSRTASLPGNTHIGGVILRSSIIPSVLGAALAASSLVAEDLVISEFMASNRATMADEDGDYSDWIEVYNPGDTAMSLDGWALTDSTSSLDKWRFPSADLGAGQFRVIFASGKDRHDPARPLHTSFKLSAGGEFLGLVAPGPRLVSTFTPRYPAQVVDASFGYSMAKDSRMLLPAGASARYLVPSSAEFDGTWTGLDFDDSAWQTGPTGIGFDRKPEPTYADLIATDVGALMDGISSTIYVRIPFTATATDLSRLLELRVRYEDGFVAYLNGVEVARRGAPLTLLRYTSRAARDRGDVDARTHEAIPLASAGGILVDGRNVLAIQALNNSNRGTDLLILPELDAVEITSIDTTAGKYFETATPGWPNSGGLPGVAAEPELSLAGGAYTESQTLILTASAPGAEVRYTTNGTVPDAASDLYTTPLSISISTLVKARAFQPGLLGSPTLTAGYVILNANVADFNSDLPLVVISTFGRTPSSGIFTTGHMMIIDRGVDGRTAITDLPDFSGFAALKTRGSSTEGTPKPSWAVEIRDDAGDDLDVEVLGMPEDSDWILHAPYSFDTALVRNPFIYELSNNVGRYATRTRFCEVFLNTRNAPLSRTTDYMGVYSFMEKIKRGPNRVDIEELLPEHAAEPEISGGYMLKIDRLDPGDSGFGAAGQSMGFVEPKEREVTAAQKTWIRSYFDDFGRALNGPAFKDPVTGYAKFVDVDSWIDHHILNVLALNVDALRLSTHFYKNRSGKIEFGPIWDFDRSMNSTDGRDDNARAWRGTGDATDFFSYPWWGRLFQDPAFYARYRERWNELRNGTLSTPSMHAIIDRMAAELEESHVRNFQKWPVLPVSAWPAQITNMKTWLADRAAWIDSQFIEPPQLSSPGGFFPEGVELSITTTNGEIYYTLNGPDPMASNATADPAALTYTGPIRITQNTRVRARNRISARVWSSLSEATFATRLEPIVITEVMYNPEAPPAGSDFRRSDFEFIEVLNIGTEPVNMTGIHLGQRPEFDFTGSTVQTLGPGEYAVVVKRIAAFKSRYANPDLKIAGEFLGTGTLSDTGQIVTLLGPLDEPLMGFLYDDAWFPETDGLGRSLVIKDPTGDRALWDLQASWRASLDVGGSPGRADEPGPADGLQLPGDVTQDGALNLTDVVGLLGHLFQGVTAAPCASDEGNLQLLDVDGNASLNLADAVHTLTHLFQGGPPPILGEACVRIVGCPAACQ